MKSGWGGEAERALVTLLMTDVEGSTAAWERDPAGMARAIVLHDQVFAGAAGRWNGTVVKPRGEGDSMFLVFASPAAAVACAVDLQRAFRETQWPVDPALRIRSAVHIGEMLLIGGDYYGPEVNRCARLRAIAHGGQALASEAIRLLGEPGGGDQIELIDLGVHRLKDVAKPERVYQISAPELRRQFPPLRSEGGGATNLPRHAAAFIGRNADIVVVTKLLSESRLVTLTGAGGVGKTRLAIRVAADLVDEYPDGVWLVELASTLDPGELARTTAAALGLHEETTRSAEDGLISFLRSRRMLVVLDNCEHLIDEVARLTHRLLEECVGTTVLATSREPLRVPGERLWRVPSLALPGVDAPAQELGAFDAVRLFVDRAQDVSSDFALTERNATAVAEICRRLDGIPLAIELAAARVSILGPDEVLDRLQHRFALLVGGPRTAPERQQTLRAALDWSVDLLSEPENALFRRLGVFVAGFTLKAAETVCNDAEVPSQNVAHLLSRLVDRSLVTASDRLGKMRYGLLETARQYALELLNSAGEDAALRLRHLEWAVSVAADADASLVGPSQREAMERLAADHDNFRAALRWGVQNGQVELSMRLANALARFWTYGDHLTEGRDWFARLLAIPETSDITSKGTRAKAMMRHGVLVLELGDTAAAVDLLEVALEAVRAHGDPECEAECMLGLGRARFYAGDMVGGKGLLGQVAGREGKEMSAETDIMASTYLGEVLQQDGNLERARDFSSKGVARARSLGDLRLLSSALRAAAALLWKAGEGQAARGLLEESLSASRSADDEVGLGRSINMLGVLAHDAGDPRTARVLFEESLGYWRRVNAGFGVAIALNNLGEVSLLEGRLEEAARFLEEAVSIVRQAGSLPALSYSLTVLARVARMDGRASEAWKYIAEALPIAVQCGRPDTVANCLDGAGEIAVLDGRWAVAARVLAAGAALRASIGIPIEVVYREANLLAISSARAELAPDEFDRLWFQGASLSLEDVVALVVEEASR